MRNIIGSAVAVDGTELKAMDYSRITVVIHGALLRVMAQLDAALARIEALESRL